VLRDLRVTHLEVIREVKDLVVLQVGRVMRVLVQQDLQVIQLRDLEVLRELRVPKDLKVLKDPLVWQLEDLQGRRVKSVIQVVVKKVKKEPMDLQDLRDLQGERDPKEIRVTKVLLLVIVIVFVVVKVVKEPVIVNWDLSPIIQVVLPLETDVVCMMV
jgi:hypothetical protein